MFWCGKLVLQVWREWQELCLNYNFRISNANSTFLVEQKCGYLMNTPFNFCLNCKESVTLTVSYTLILQYIESCILSPFCPSTSSFFLPSSLCHVPVILASVFPATEGACFVGLFYFAILCGSTRFVGATPCWQDELAWLTCSGHPVQANSDTVIL